jgi:membrane fusion protein (multidrug efflux system)
MLGGCEKPTSGAAQMEAKPPEVAVVTVQPERVAITTELPARTAAYLIAEVRPQVGGIIQERLFEEGGDVKQGDVLYQIDPASYQAAYDTAIAALARAEANLPSIQLRVSRYEEAVAAKAVSQQEYDDAVGALKQADADVAYGKAAVQSARINLGYTRVTAPISGRIGKSNVTVGALVSAHQGAPLATIQQLDPIYVDAPQSSANLLRMKRLIAAGRIKSNGSDQTRVKILLEDGTPYPVEGTLKFPDVSVDPTTGSFILRMVVPNPNHVLLPGMYVRAILEEGVMDRAILVPQQGVSRDHKGNPVALVVDAENRIEQRILTADRAIGDKWLVSSGLSPGDLVVVEGAQKVRPGDVVKAVPFDPAPTESNHSPQAVQPTTQAN